VQVHAVDGYEGLRRGADLQRLVAEIEPDLVLVGLGAGLQEKVLIEAAEGMSRGYALTCGGFLDQVLQSGYYPSWAYPLRLNWLVRLAREPRRLWRRYTTHALVALVLASAWRQSMVAVPGLLAHAQMCVLGSRDDDRL
jgi:UDP-N-acetyl-D-mannosaminuronic acid transferase (WecB/TagA/CpsF family)